MLPSHDTRHGGKFRLLGFPTTVRPGFPLFIVVIAFLYPWPLGAWVGGSIAVLTVVHELGHALVARRFGCEARISLDFMVAYASFAPSPDFGRLRRALVALAGPGAQVLLATSVLLIMGINPVSRASISTSDAAVGIWWTGIVLGLVNLLPLAPLDGGAVVASALDALFPGRGQRIMLRASIVITATVVSTMVATGHTEFLMFFAFVLFFQWQTLRAERSLEGRVSLQGAQPSGDPYLDAAVATAQTEAGRAASALTYCRDSWSMCPNSAVAVAASRACVALGDVPAALQWIDAAVRVSLDDLETLGMINTAHDLDTVRSLPGFGDAVRRLSAGL